MTNILAIGWLDPPHPIPTGAPVDPGTVARLRELTVNPWELGHFNGFHPCGYCPDDRTMGVYNLLVPGEDVVYAAPQLVSHYITEHHYRPPDCFLDAVDRCPPMHSAGYHAALAAHGIGRHTYSEAPPWFLRHAHFPRPVPCRHCGDSNVVFRLLATGWLVCGACGCSTDATTVDTPFRVSTDRNHRVGH